MSINLSVTLSDEDIATIAEQVAALIGNAVSEVADDTKSTGKKKKGDKGKKGKKAEAEPEPEAADDAEEEAGEDDADRRAELTKMRITSLRKIARELGYDEDEIAAADKETLVQTILDDEANSDDADEDADADEPDDDDTEDTDDDGDDADWTREDFEEMSLKELKGIAKEAGYSAADIKGLDQEELIDFLLGEGEEDGEEESEEEDDSYTEADLKAMPIKELLALAKEWEVKIPTADKKSKSKIIKKLLAD